MKKSGRLVRAVFSIELLACLMAAFLLAGCGQDNPGSASASDEAKSGDVLFSDDFSKVPNGWGTWDRDDAVVTYEQGGLRILVNKPDFDFWSVSGRKFADVSITVDVRKLGGSTDNDFGILCRYQNAQNFYMFLVSSDGYYGIGKLIDDQHSLIGIEQLQYTDLIRQDVSEYKLRADCVRDKLSLYVDGNLLLEVGDSDMASGDVGVIAGAYSNPGVDMLFDNFKVTQP